MSRKKNPDSLPMEKLTVLVDPFAIDEAHETGLKRGDKNISETVRKALDSYVQGHKTENRTAELEKQNMELALENRDLLLINSYLEKQAEIYERALKAYEEQDKEKKKCSYNQD